MKKATYSILLALFAVMLPTVFLTSCGGSDDDGPDSGILGTWYVGNGEDGETVTFKSNGKVIVRYEDYGDIETEEAKYTFDGKILTITAREVDYDYGSRYVYEVVGTGPVVFSEDGEMFTWDARYVDSDGDTWHEVIRCYRHLYQ